MRQHEAGSRAVLKSILVFARGLLARSVGRSFVTFLARVRLFSRRLEKSSFLHRTPATIMRGQCFKLDQRFMNGM